MSIYIFVYEKESELIGYSIIVDQENEKNLYAWYGGVLPELQGNGITQKFFDRLIKLAIDKEYLSISLATSNIRPHMLRLAIKMGFDIVDLKKREYGEGNKIYFKYKILPPYTEEICFTENGEMIKFVQIEEKLVRAYKKNCTVLKLSCYKDTLDALAYAVRYCNSFWKKPKVLINLYEAPNMYSEVSKIIEEYKGEIEIMN